MPSSYVTFTGNSSTTGFSFAGIDDYLSSGFLKVCIELQLFKLLVVVAAIGLRVHAAQYIAPRSVCELIKTTGRRTRVLSARVVRAFGSTDSAQYGRI